MESVKRIVGRVKGSYWTCAEHGRVFLTKAGMQRHREMEHGDNLVIYRCTECGKVYYSLFWLHSHAETHTGLFSFANVDDLMAYTEKLEVTDYETVPVDG